GFDEVIDIEKFAGGQSNPSYKITTLEQCYVLRKQPDGDILQSAHAVDREYRVMAALADSSVPVPKVLYLCTDKRIFGSYFYVMEFVDGNIHWNPALPEVEAPNRKDMYRQVCKTLADLHCVDFNALGLS